MTVRFSAPSITAAAKNFFFALLKNSKNARFHECVLERLWSVFLFVSEEFGEQASKVNINFNSLRNSS